MAVETTFSPLVFAPRHFQTSLLNERFTTEPTDISEQGSSLLVGKVRSLFQANPVPFAGGSNYEVTCDGKKFVVASLASSQESEPLTVVVNWTTLQKQKYCSQRTQNPQRG